MEYFERPRDGRKGVFGFKKNILVILRRIQQMCLDSRKYILKGLRKSFSLGISYFDLKREKKQVPQGLVELKGDYVSDNLSAFSCLGSEHRENGVVVEEIKDIRDKKNFFGLPIVQLEPETLYILPDGGECVARKGGEVFGQEKMITRDDYKYSVLAFLDEELGDIEEELLGTRTPQKIVDVDKYVSDAAAIYKSKKNFFDNQFDDLQIKRAQQLMSGINPNPGPKVGESSKDIKNLPLLRNPFDYSNYNLGFCLYKFRLNIKKLYCFSMCVNELEMVPIYKCYTNNEFISNREVYSRYRIESVKTQVRILDGLTGVSQVESIFNVGSVTDLSVWEGIKNLNRNHHYYKPGVDFSRYVEGYYFVGSKSSYGSDFDNDVYRSKLSKMYLNLIFDTDNGSTVDVYIACQVLFFARKVGDDSVMSRYASTIV